MLRFIPACVFAALMATAMPALACLDDNGHSTSGKRAAAAKDHHVMAIPADASPSTKNFMEANATMHKDMAIAFTGDADVDFVRGMIPHHQGAIDMAKVLLTYGKDPELQKLANGIITAQTTEIAQMQSWLKQHGH